ncbi:MAG TPA: hypothetical protein VHO25_09845, partial [Polyangiaceae bacterium]|nr:hypothetical protein [Polyangiaceae bacterium]
MTKRKVLGVLAMLVATGCAPKQKGALDANGYSSAVYALSVKNASHGGIVSNRWRLDNLWPKRSKLVPKDSAEYMTKFFFDVDGDGKADSSEKDFLYELRLANLHDDGIIWLRTFPIAAHDAQKDLRVLMKEYVDGASHNGFEVVVIGAAGGAAVAIVQKPRYAGKVLHENATSLGGATAYEATIDVANVDRIAVEPGAVEKRVKMVLVRPGFTRTVKSKGRKYEFPVLLLAGYSNNVKDFDAAGKEFDELLNRVVVT